MESQGGINIELIHLYLLSFIACTNTNLLTSIVEQSNQLKWFKIYFCELKNKKILLYNIKIILYCIQQKQ